MPKVTFHKWTQTRDLLGQYM